MSSVERVTEPAAVRLLTQGRARWVLGAFLQTEYTVGGAARDLKLDIRVVHREVQALVKAGLLRVVRAEKRAGRPIKVYRAAAEAFFVPFSATRAADFSELSGRRAQRYDELLTVASAREFQRLYQEQSAGREWGLRVYVHQAGQVQVDQAYAGAALVNAAVRYQGPTGLMLDIRPSLRLTTTQAREVQLELIRLLSRLHDFDLENQAAGEGQAFLLRLGLIGITPEEAQSLQ